MPMRLCLCILTFCFTCSSRVWADDSDLNLAIGAIRDIDTGQPLGTGFIARNVAGQVAVVTAYHVSGSHRVELDLPGPEWQGKPLRLRHFVDLPQQDLASFSIENNSQAPAPILTWSLLRPHVAEKIAFWGVDFAKRQVGGQRTTVDSLGISSLADGSVIDFLDFRADAYKGFSGSPVFVSGTRNVIGVIIQGWYQCADHNEPPVIYDRAVMLTVPDVEILFGGRRNSSPTAK